MKFVQWSTEPVPIWAADAGPSDVPNQFEPPVLDLLVDHSGLVFRGVGLDRLPTILATGVDVSPTDSLIYCAEMDKANEYGDFPRVIMAFRYRDENKQTVLHRATATIFPFTSPDNAAELRALYPFETARRDDCTVHLSRINPTDTVRMNYARDHGHFLPGDPWRALVGLFVVADADGLAAAHETVRTALAVRRSP